MLWFADTYIHFGLSCSSLQIFVELHMKMAKLKENELASARTRKEWMNEWRIGGEKEREKKEKKNW